MEEELSIAVGVFFFGADVVVAVAGDASEVVVAGCTIFSSPVAMSIVANVKPSYQYTPLDDVVVEKVPEVTKEL